MRKTSLRLLSIVIFATLSMSVSGAAMVYKCKNAQGKLLYQKTPCTVEAVSSWTPKTDVNTPKQEPVKKTPEVLVIKQGEGGHYFLAGEVNGHPLTFVVDTGASIVALPRTFANSVSLSCTDNVKMDTANGISDGCMTTIKELKVGDFVLNNVMALIIDKLTQPLLGMNALQNFNYEQKNGEMRLSEQNSNTAK